MKRIVVDLTEEEFDFVVESLETQGDLNSLTDLSDDIIDKLYEGSKEHSLWNMIPKSMTM